MTDTLPARPKAVNTGMVEAFVLAGLCLVAIPLAPPSIIPCAVFLAIAFGLRRGYAWSGYGGALFLAARWAAERIAELPALAASGPAARTVSAPCGVNL